MAAFIGVRTFNKPTGTLKTILPSFFSDRSAPRSTFFRTLGAPLFLFTFALTQNALPQFVAADTSAVATPVSAPNLIRWTGSLPKMAGQTVNVSFSLYQESSGGTALWSEVQPIKVGADGRYSVLLGATSTEGLSQTLFQAGEARWIEAQPLQTQLNSASSADASAETTNAVTPARSLLSVVPYAFKSVDADTLAGRAATDYVTREDLQSTLANQVQTITSTKAPTSNAASPLPIIGTPLPILGSSSSSSSSSGGGTPLNGSGVSGFLPAWTNSATLGNSMIAESGTNVGIGTSMPATMLDVNGASTLRGSVNLLAAAATLAAGINSPALQLGASSYSSASSAAVPQNFVWQAQSTGNNTASPAANLSLLFGSGVKEPSPTGLSIAPNGQINFAPGQTFPIATSSTITGITAGPGLSGGGYSGNVAISLSGPIATSNGGTGATSAAGALANLGAQAALPGVASDGANGINVSGGVTANTGMSALSVNGEYNCGASTWPSIQVCLDASTAHGWGAYLPAGTYQGPITVNTGLNLRGDKAKTIINCPGGGANCITFATYAAHFVISGVTLTTSASDAGAAIQTSTVYPNTHWVLRDIFITVIGTGRFAYGFYSSGAESSEIYSMDLNNCCTVGVHLDNSSNQLKFYGLEITGGQPGGSTIQRGIEIGVGTASPEFFGVTVQGYFAASTVNITGSSPFFYASHFESTGSNYTDCGSPYDVCINANEFLFSGNHMGNFYIGYNNVITRGGLITGGMVGSVLLGSNTEGIAVRDVRVGTGISDNTYGGQNFWSNVRNTSGNPLPDHGTNNSPFQPILGFTPENSANKGLPMGYLGINYDGSITVTRCNGCLNGSSLPSGITATTQTSGDNSNNVATDAFVQSAVSKFSSAGTMLIFSNGPAQITAGSTNYFGPNQTPGSPSEAAVLTPVAAPVTLSNLYCVVDVYPPTGQNIAFTLRTKGNTDTALTCTITGAYSTTCNDVSHTVSLSAGQLVTLKAVTSSNSGSLRPHCSVQAR